MQPDKVLQLTFIVMESMKTISLNSYCKDVLVIIKFKLNLPFSCYQTVKKLAKEMITHKSKWNDSKKINPL